MARSLAFVTVAALLYGAAFGDGMAFTRPTDDTSVLEPLPERTQAAAIAHADGVQRMIITVDFELDEAAEALWIFPAPGDPNAVVLDVLDQFSLFQGDDLCRDARRKVDGLMSLFRASQVYPIFAEAFLSHSSYMTRSHEDVAGGPIMGGGKSDVFIHAEVSKWGIRSEAVTATSFEALADYLRGKNAAIKEDHVQSFRPYFAEGYVFVLVWIESQAELVDRFATQPQHRQYLRFRRPCIFVQFPTPTIFYPLKPTSGYGQAVVPVRLFLVGHVMPQADPSLLADLHCGYFRQERGREGFDRLLSGHNPRGMDYTLVRLAVPASRFVDDLRFEPGAPTRVRFAAAVSDLDAGEFFWLYALIGFLAVSYASAGVASSLVFGRWHPHAQMGFWNAFGLPGVLLGIYLRIGDHADDLRFQARRFGPFGLRFWHLFTIAFLAFTILIQVAFALLLGPDTFGG